jgi:hypothetical protein
MRLHKLVLIASLLLMAGLLPGCSREPLRMKNQPTNPDSGETQIELPGKKKPFNVAQ